MRSALVSILLRSAASPLAPVVRRKLQIRYKSATHSDVMSATMSANGAKPLDEATDVKIFYFVGFGDLYLLLLTFSSSFTRPSKKVINCFWACLIFFASFLVFESNPKSLFS